MADEQTATPAPTDSILARLREWDTAAGTNSNLFRGELTVTISPADLLRVCDFLRTGSALLFDFLSDITVVDRFPIEPRFELNYHLLSLSLRQRLRLKTQLSGQQPVLDSVIPVWPTANWHEREAFDLFGIRFEGHPDLTRILLPEDWEGYPLRKDYPTEGYR